jgi:hypothetical protein
MRHEFAARAVLYRDWDGELRARTRFFAAAALTNAALAECCTSLFVRLACRSALDFLCLLGERLLHLNLELARAVPYHEGALRERDDIWIKLEQLSVECLLRQLCRVNRPLAARIITQIDVLLWCLAHRVGRNHYGPGAEALSMVISRLSYGHARRLSFGSLTDRIAIGSSLIGLTHRGQSE